QFPGAGARAAGPHDAAEAWTGAGGGAGAATAGTPGTTGTTSAEDWVRGPRPLTYAVLSAAARRQVLPGTGRPHREADVRAVPWWRVRSLRWVAGVPKLLGAPVLVGTGLLMLLSRSSDYPAVVAYAVIAFGAGFLLHSGHRFLTAGRPAARLLARAARGPVPVPKRYALLFDPHGGAPVLVLFPGGDGAADLPEAVLPLRLPGTLKQPRRGVPSAPAGPVELRGVTDGAGRPVVVPWIEGRPLWPSGPYEELRAGDRAAREYLERLAPPQEARVVPGSPAA
ncbi:hypothetical protein VO63_25680, partial [Streptomyces showdoensis]